MRKAKRLLVHRKQLFTANEHGGKLTIKIHHFVYNGQTMITVARFIGDDGIIKLFKLWKRKCNLKLSRIRYPG